MQFNDGMFAYVRNSTHSDLIEHLNEGRVNSGASCVIFVSQHHKENKVSVVCCDSKNTVSEETVISLPKHAHVLLSLTTLSAPISANEFSLPATLGDYSAHYVVMGAVCDIHGNRIGALLLIHPNLSLTNEQQSFADITRQKIELRLQYQLLQHPFTDKLQEKVALLNEIGRISHTGGWEFDVAQREITWTHETYCLFGMTPGRQVTLDRALGNFTEKSRKHIRAAILEVLRKGNAFTLEAEFINGEGHKRWLKMTGKAQCIASKKRPKVYRIFGSAQDITETKRLSDTQHNYTQYLSTILNNLGHALLTLDEEGTVITANNLVRQVFGYDPDEMIGQEIFILMDKNESGQLSSYAKGYSQQQSAAKEIKDVRDFLAQSSCMKGESMAKALVMKRKNGGNFCADVIFSTFFLDNQRRTVALCRDMTEQNFQLEQLKDAAYLDRVTKLPNLHAFDTTLKRTIRECKATLGYLFCLRINIVNLDQYRQAFGGATTDYITRIIAARLERSFSGTYRVYSESRDSYLVMYEAPLQDGENGASALINEVEWKLVNDVFGHITLHNSPHYLQANVNTCWLEGKNLCFEKVKHMIFQTPPEGSLQNTHERVRLYQGSTARYERYQSIKQSLLRSVENKELFIVLQPQYGDAGNIIGAEALLRWQHPQLGLISPGEFIPIAEESDIIVEIGQWVMNETCKLLCDCQEVGIQTRLAINVSAKHIARADFSESLLSIVDRWKVPPGSITLELTEGTLIHSFGLVRKRIRELALKGFVFSIDDFGRGNSNLSYLKELPIKELKVDRHFIDEVNLDGSKSLLINSICDMAKIFDLRAVAEGIENTHQLRYAKDCGCTGFQGYFLDKPMRVHVWREKLLSEKSHTGDTASAERPH